MKPLIEIKNLNVIYNLGKINEFTALKNINLEIYPGEYVTFFGPSGCGKSTLLYIIAGLEFPTTGDVLVNSQLPQKLTHQELVNFHRYTVGMVFQAYYLIPHLNVLNNVMLPEIFSGTDVHQRIVKAEELMKRFDIDSLAKRKPSQLSGGQQQRVAIARALSMHPSILLADEPTGNIASQQADEIMAIFQKLNQEGNTIIMITHEPDIAEKSKRIIIIRDGQIVSDQLNKQQIIKNKISKKDVSL